MSRESVTGKTADSVCYRVGGSGKNPADISNASRGSELLIDEPVAEFTFGVVVDVESLGAEPVRAFQADVALNWTKCLGVIVTGAPEPLSSRRLLMVWAHGVWAKLGRFHDMYSFLEDESSPTH